MSQLAELTGIAGDDTQQTEPTGKTKQIYVKGVGPVEFPAEMSNEQIKSVLDKTFKQRAPSTTAGAAASGFVRELGPTAAFVGGAAKGARIGAAAGALVPGAGETGISEAVGSVVGGLVGGTAASIMASKAQRAIADVVAPESIFGSAREAQQMAEHPWAVTLGGLLSGVPFFKVSPGTIFKEPAKAAVAAGVGAAAGVVTPLVEGQKPTLGGILESAGYGLIYGHPRFGPQSIIAKPITPEQQAILKVAKKNAPIAPATAAELTRQVKAEAAEPFELKGQKLKQPTPEKGAPSAIQERSAEKVSLATPPGDRQKVVEGAPTKGEEAPIPQKEEKVVAEPHELFLRPTAQVGENYYVGRTHSEAVGEARKAGEAVPDENEHMRGFLTSEGKFIGRKTAQKLFEAKTGKKITRPEGLHSEDLIEAGLLPESFKAGKAGAPGEDLEAAYLEAERAGMREAQQANLEAGLPHEVETGQVEGGADVPFAIREKELARPSADGKKIVLNVPEVRRWLAQMAPEMRDRALKSLFSEEGIHAMAVRVIPDAAAAKLWNGLTKLEKYLVERSYFGEDRAKARPSYTDAQMGHEYVRRAMQRLMGSDVREVIEARARGEHWVKESVLDAIEKVLFTLRKVMPGEGNEILRDMVSKLQGNIEAAKKARFVEGAAGEAQPAAFRKPVTIRRPDGTEYEGEFTGYYDFPGKGPIASIGRKEGDKMTHGMLQEGEKIVTPVPSFEEWQKSQPPAAFSKLTPDEKEDYVQRIMETEDALRISKGDLLAALKKPVTDESTQEVNLIKEEIAGLQSWLDGAYERLQKSGGAELSFPAAYSKQIESPEFKSWFADSKVVNEDGTPKVMFHSSRANVLDTNAIKDWTKTPYPKKQVKIDVFRPYTHFGTINQAEQAMTGGGGATFSEYGPTTYPVFLNIKNPKRVTDVPDHSIGGSEAWWRDQIKQAQAEGYDGLVYRNEREPDSPVPSHIMDWSRVRERMGELHKKYGSPEEGYLSMANVMRAGTPEEQVEASQFVKSGAFLGYDNAWRMQRHEAFQQGKYADSYVIFDPTQVKSAIANKGEFSRTQPSIAAAYRKPRSSAGEPTLPGFEGPVGKQQESAPKYVKETVPTPSEFGKTVPAKAVAGISEQELQKAREELYTIKYQSPSSTAIEKSITDWIKEKSAKGEPPKYEDVMEAISYAALPKGTETYPGQREHQQRAFENLTHPSQIADAWKTAWANYLSNASGAELEKLRKTYGMEHNFGTRPIPDPVPGSDMLKMGGEEIPESVKKQWADIAELINESRKARATSARDKAEQMEEMAKKYPSGFGAEDDLLRRAKALRALADRIESGADDVEGATLIESAKEREPIDQSRQRYRAKVMTGIMDRAFKDIPETRAASLKRTTVGVDDLGWWRRSPGKVVREISEADRSNIGSLGELLTEHWRASDQDPVSHTLRLTAMLDTKTNQVDVVSTYKDPRRGAVVVDPMAPTGMRPNITLEDALHQGRFKPIMSFLLSEPVTNFHKRFKELADFKNELSKPGLEMARAESSTAEAFTLGQLEASRVFEEQHGFSPEVSELPPEGEAGGQALGLTQMERGEGGSFQGRQADIARAAAGFGKGELQRYKSVPVTDREAGKLLAHIKYIAGNFTSPDAVRASLAALVKNPDRQVISAYAKLYHELQRRRPDLSPLDAVDALAEDLYETHALNPGSEAFIAKAVARTTPPSPSFVGTGAPGVAVTPGRVEAVQRDITIPGKRPAIPTAPRPEFVGRAEPLPSVIPREQEAPTPTPEGLKETAMPVLLRAGGELPVGGTRFAELGSPIVSGVPKFMPHEERVGLITPKSVRQRPTKYIPQVTPEGWTKNPPAAFYKRAQDLKQISIDNWKDAQRRMTAAVTRHSTIEDIFRFADGFDNEGRQYSLQAGNAVRAASMQEMAPEVKSADRFSFKRFKAVREAKAEARKVRNASIAVIASMTRMPNGAVVPNMQKLDTFYRLTQTAENKADVWSRSMDPRKRIVSRKWKKAAQELRAGIEYAQQNWVHASAKDWGKTPLSRTVVAAGREFRDEMDWEKANGWTINDRQGYVPGLYEGEFWNDDKIMFGKGFLLGQSYRKPKAFNNYYEAIASGPYVPASLDIADLVQHRLMTGRAATSRLIWMDALKGMTDPVSKKPVAVSAVPVMGPVTAMAVQVTDPATGLVVERPIESTTIRDPVTGQEGPVIGLTGDWKSPDREYEVVRIGNRSKPIAVRRGYVDAVELATMRSGVAKSPVGAGALVATGILKHGVLLALDTFHPGRLLQYAVAATPFSQLKKAFPRSGGGFSALNYRPEDMPRAVESGLIAQKSADWALGVVQVADRGRLLTMTRQDLANRLVAAGLNTVKINDGLYKDAIASVPIVGKAWHNLVSPVNKLVFDYMVPGIATESAVRTLERLNRERPDIPLDTLIKDVIRDTNFTYGSLGRQGVFKNPTWRDLAQIFLLAPAWQEALLQKELRSYARLPAMAEAGVRAGLSKLGVEMDPRNNFVQKVFGRQGLPAGGMLGRTVGAGLFGYFLISQAINLATRKKPTWENEEEGHFLDAAIPMGEDTLWLSPLSVFAETMHDVMRLSYSKPHIFKTLEQIGLNKAGPVGRMAYVLATSQTPTGQTITSGTGVAKTAAEQLAVGPISVSTPAKWVANKVAPDYVPGVTGAQLGQRVLGSVGIKTSLGETGYQQILKKADAFMRENGLKKETGWQQVPTDEPSYSKLRTALRHDDKGEVRNQLQGLMKTHQLDKVWTAMQQWAKRPFTGNNNFEGYFISSLSAEEQEIYWRANMEREETMEKFIQALTELGF